MQQKHMQTSQQGTGNFNETQTFIKKFCSIQFSKYFFNKIGTGTKLWKAGTGSKRNSSGSTVGI
jgi:hypothetical protein